MKKGISVLLYVMLVLNGFAIISLANFSLLHYDFREELPSSMLKYVSDTMTTFINQHDENGLPALSLAADTTAKSAVVTSRCAFDPISITDSLCIDTSFSYNTSGPDSLKPDKYFRLINADDLASNPSISINLVRIQGDSLKIGAEEYYTLERGVTYSLKMFFDVTNKTLTLWLNNQVITPSPVEISISSTVLENFNFSKARIMISNGYPANAGVSVFNLYHLSASPSKNINITSNPQDGAAYVLLSTVEEIKICYGSLYVGTPAITIRESDINGDNEKDVDFDFDNCGMWLKIIPHELNDLKKYTISLSGINDINGNDASTVISFFTADANFIPTAVEISAPILSIKEGERIVFTPEIRGSAEVEKVEWYANGMLEASFYEEPFDFTFYTTEKGTYAVHAEVTNIFGITAKSEKLSIEVKENIKPAVTINLEDKVDINNLRSVLIRASDQDGYIKSVALYINNKLIGMQNGNETEEYRFNISADSLGRCTVKAVATDDSGAASETERSVIFIHSKIEQKNFLDFNNYTGINMPFPSSGAYNSAGNETTRYDYIEIDSEHGKSFATYVTENSGKGSIGPWVGFPIATSDVAHIEFELYLTEDNLTLPMYVADRSVSPAISNRPMWINGGNLKIISQGAEMNSVRLSKGKWYKFEYKLDVSDNTFSLYVYENGVNIVSCDKYLLDKKMSVFSDFRFFFGGGIKGAFCLDNVKYSVETVLPYITGVLDDDGNIAGDGVIDYKNKEVSVKLSSALSSVSLSDITMLNEIGNVKIKSVKLDNTTITVTPDYKEDKGFEPSNKYIITIGKNAKMANGDTIGYKNAIEFSTSNKELDLINAYFSKNEGVSFSADAINLTGSQRCLTAVMIVFENGMFKRTVTANSYVENNQSKIITTPPVKCAVKSVVKAFLIDEGFRPVSNKIYTLVCE